MSCRGETHVDCGAACATSRRMCFTSIMGMIKAVFDVITNIAEMIATAGGTAAVKASIKAAMKAAFNMAKNFVKKGMTKGQIIKLLMKAGKNKMAQATAKKLAGHAMNHSNFKWEDLADLDPTGIATAVLAFKKGIC